MAQRTTREDAGNITITTILIAIPLALLVVGGLSLGIVFARWSVLSSALATARETTMTAGFQMMLKSCDTPGSVIAEKLAAELRTGGVDDELTVWFAESTDTALGDSTRAFAYYAVIEETYGEGTLLGMIEIPCSTTASIVPYAASRVYKPTPLGVVERYRFGYGSMTGTLTTLPLSDQTPQALIDALRESEGRALSQ